MDLEKIELQYLSKIEKYERLNYVVRGIELHKEGCAELEQDIRLIQTYKKEAIALKDERSANQLFYYELTFWVLYFELMMWVNIKNDNPNEAWDNLVDAQEHLLFAQKIIAHENLEKRYQKLKEIERIIFPPQTFSSVGYIVEKYRCSICNSNYLECDHEKGEIYLGELCGVIIEKVSKVEEISIVENPANRKCRVHTINNKDVMTLREVKRG